MVITIGELTVNTITRRTMISGEDILLTPREFAILLYLVQNAGEEVQAEQLYEAAWGQPMVEDANAVRFNKRIVSGILPQDSHRD